MHASACHRPSPPRWELPAAGGSANGASTAASPTMPAAGRPRWSTSTSRGPTPGPSTTATCWRRPRCACAAAAALLQLSLPPRLHRLPNCSEQAEDGVGQCHLWLALFACAQPARAPAGVVRPHRGAAGRGGGAAGRAGRQGAFLAGVRAHLEPAERVVRQGGGGGAVVELLLAAACALFCHLLPLLPLLLPPRLPRLPAARSNFCTPWNTR